METLYISDDDLLSVAEVETCDKTTQTSPIKCLNLNRKRKFGQMLQAPGRQMVMPPHPTVYDSIPMTTKINGNMPPTKPQAKTLIIGDNWVSEFQKLVTGCLCIPLTGPNDLVLQLLCKNQWQHIIITVGAEFNGVEIAIGKVRSQFASQNASIIIVTHFGIKSINAAHIKAQSAQMALGIIKRKFIQNLVVEDASSLDYRLGLLFNF